MYQFDNYFFKKKVPTAKQLAHYQIS